MTLRSAPSLLNAAADRDGDAVAITCGSEQITREELRRRTNRLARAYAQLGVEHGSLVTIALPNSIEFLEVAVAAWKLGAVPQPVSNKLPDRERQAIVELADSALVVGAPATAHPGRQVLPARWEPPADLSDDDLPDAVSPTWKAPTSGGSTGRPKLILSGAPAMFDDSGPSSGFGIGNDGCVGVPGPLYHNAPFQWASLGLFGANHVVLLPKFDAADALAMLHEHRPTSVLLVPTMMSRMLRLPEEQRQRYDLSSVQHLWHMAAPCPAWVKQGWIDWIGAEHVYELYAGTEAQAVTIIRGDEWLAHRGSVGRVVVGEMRVLDPVTHEEKPVGELGEVFMRPRDARPTYRYLGAEAHRIADGWESLGDMGWFDADGYLYLGDRKSDMILSGGANIYPAETESALAEHPHVVSSAVIGLPDEDLGKRVHAVVQFDPTVAPNGIDEAELRGFLAERLVRYKIPRTFEFTTEVVRDDAGKVRRSALADERAIGQTPNQASSRIVRSVPTLNWLQPGGNGPAGPGTVPRQPLVDLADAAAAAGFDGIGLDDLTVRAFLDDGHTMAEVAALLRERSLVCTDIGLLRITTDVAATVAAAQWLADLAQACGAATCITVLGARPDEPAIVDALRAATDVLRPVGVRLALEFAPFSRLATLEETTTLCERVGWERCGVLLDSWHVFRGATAWSSVEALRADQLALVHFDDAREPISDDLAHETRYRRMPPGEGVFPLDRFVAAVVAKGYRGAVSVEVLSDELRAMPPSESMRVLFDAFDRTWPRA